MELEEQNSNEILENLKAVNNLDKCQTGKINWMGKHDPIAIPQPGRNS
jgi:hypothetical protein